MIDARGASKFPYCGFRVRKSAPRCVIPPSALRRQRPDVIHHIPGVGLADALGLKPSRLPWAVLAGGLVGLVATVVGLGALTVALWDARPPSAPEAPVPGGPAVAG